MISLAVKYRPTTFNDVVAQENIKAILEQQIVTKNHKNCYLFTGGAGTGKTTIKDSKSISIQKEWIEKLKEECFAMRKPYWAISFSFGDNEDYFIINEKLFKQLMEACNNE